MSQNSSPGGRYGPSSAPGVLGLPTAACVLLLTLTLTACGEHSGSSRFDLMASTPATGTEPTVPVDSMKFEVPPPPFKDPDIFPCSQCHNPDDLTPNPTRRKLDMAHEEIVLRHDEEHRWCLDCHDTNNRDQLRLANGTPVPFTESYRLCGQCHGDKYRDWRAGVHGRRTGSWDGDKQYLLCVFCHDSHQPHFKPLEPKPAPRRPGRID